MRNNINSMILADFYKLSHRLMYPTNTQAVYSTWTPRTSRIDGVKKSQKGAVAVFQDSNGKISYQDEFMLDDCPKNNLLRTVFQNGLLTVEEKFSEIKSRVLKGI
jgi:nicotinic acid phosphoribosyltransferase